MTLSELIDQLTELQQECGDEDPTVMMAHQPNWPLQMALASVVLHDPLQAFMDEYGPAPDDGDPAWQDAHDAAQAAGKTVYVAEGWGGGNGYLTEGVSELLGWR